ncbi:MAG: hypothetical protein CFE23_05405 [Flavobacterium sp. BFFFF1]|nr:MAG: hypothetical protein CFE23_05405 [Flavobacterium sp. BFFFF1]
MDLYLHMEKTYGRSNFHKHTFCVFDERPLQDVAGTVPQYKSQSGSSYFFRDNGVYRLSDHWGRAANCKWRLQSDSADKSRGMRLGFALWTSFHPDNDTEKLYYIDVDTQGQAHYQHKGHADFSAAKALFTAAEVTKRIREIRSILYSDAWSRHYDGDPESLRTQLIHSITVVGMTLQEARIRLLK